MVKAVLKSKIIKPDKAVLIIDKIGVIGEALAREFSKDFYVVLLSGRNHQLPSKRIDKIFFKGKIPKVPKNRYSKIFLIDDGNLITRQSSTSFVKEAKRINSDFYFLGSVRNHDVKFSNEIITIYDKAKVLIFGDLFDKDFLFDPDSSISKFIVSVTHEKLIKVSNDGLSLSFPMGFRDTIKLIIKASYLDIDKRIILLFYKNPITDISLAHIFQKIDPDIKVDYIKVQNQENLFIPDGAEFAISKYDIKNKIEDIDFENNKKVLISKKRKNKTSFKLFKFLVFIMLLLFFIFSLPFITSSAYSELGKIQLQKSINLAKENKFDEALGTINKADSFFQISKNANVVLDKQLALLKLDDNLGKFTKKHDTKEEVVNSVVNLFMGLNYLKNVYEGKSLSPSEDFNNGVNSLKESYFGSLGNDSLSDDFGNYADELKDLQNFVEFAGVTSDVLPEVFGFNGEKKYLLLFQDSTDLTNGGGKISAFGRIDMKNGRVEKYEVISINEINDLANAKVEPPYFIKRYLKKVNLSFEESNYDSDFVTNAISATSLYSLVKNEEMDGVVGVDVYFIKKMLDVMGPVYIEAINGQVNSENVMQILAENENNEIFVEIIKKLKNEKAKEQEISVVDLLGSFGELISEKHLMFAFKDSEVQNVFLKNKLSGSLADNRINSNEKINDFFGISEHNLDLNKVNYFISRSIEKNNIINKNETLESDVKITFKNSSERDNSYAKTYKTYFQIILPAGSILKNISVGGKSKTISEATMNPLLIENTNFRSGNGIEVEQRQINNKSIFGFLVSVSPDSMETVKVRYELPFSLSNISVPINYSLIVYKQSGIESFPFTLGFNKNSNYVILPINSISEDVKTDKEYNFVITKK